MPLAAGSKLGPYEIAGQIGAGGMGEVYRAKDPRLGRDVAIKVLPASFSQDADRLRRFEQEAKAAGLLNHPNITIVYDIGSADAAPYVVQELLEGETLRAELASGRFSPRKAIDYGIQIAHGLAAAHDKGIVHRDLKPENVFVTKDGRLKILDFGLAKLTQMESGSGPQTNLPTATAATEPGVVMGTLGYMSPEQVKGKPADARSDIFAFGAILYEMLAGRRAFHGDSAAETMSAILREEPPDLSVTNQSISPALDRIIRHSIEKSPERRFHSAHDVAFALEDLSGASVPSAATAAASARAAARPAVPAWLLRAAGVAAIAAAVAGAYVVGRRAQKPVAPPSFVPLTFRQEPIFNARFAPDGKTVVYSAAPSGNAPQIFSLRPDYPGAARGLSGVHLLSISSRGELAVLTHPQYLGHALFDGTLARMPLEGGAPREILAGVREADWSPDGSDLALIRVVNGKDRLEFPAGKVLHEAGGYLSNPRFSPDGKHIAFFEHPVKYDDRGLVAVVDLSGGGRRVLSEGYWGEEGLAWSAAGDEVMFSAGTSYNDFSVYAVTLAGRRRTAVRSAGGLTIHDVARDGRWIATRDDFFREMMVLAPGQEHERDLAWLDLSDATTMSADGRTLLFREDSGSVGANYAACLRQTDGSPVVRLGEGFPGDLSRDGKWVLASIPTTPQQLVLYPTGAGTTLRLDRGGIVSYDSLRFFPDGRTILVCGHEEGHAVRCYTQAVAGGKPRPLTPEGTTKGFVSPDGRSVIVEAAGAGLLLCPVGGGEPRPVPGAGARDEVIAWPSDGRSIVIRRIGEVPVRFERLDLSTGKREPIKMVGPTDLTGVLQIGSVTLSDDEKSHAYSSFRSISHLFLVNGAK